MIPNGKYTIVYKNNEYRTIELSTPKKGGLEGKQILGLPSDEPNKFKGVAFVTDRGLVFWKKFSATQTPERLNRIRKAFATVAGDPGKAGQAYGVRSGRCHICNRELTTPASLAAGIGPECAGKVNWAKADQVAGAIALRPDVLVVTNSDPKPEPDKKELFADWNAECEAARASGIPETDTGWVDVAEQKWSEQRRLDGRVK